MEVFLDLAVLRIILVLGIINFISAAALFLFCRCVPQLFGGQIMKRKWYSRFYKYHCYLWWIFWPSVIVHAILAIGRYLAST